MSSETYQSQDEKHPMTQHQQKFCSTIATLIRLLTSPDDTVEKVLVFYHQGCPDGIISALLLKYASINDNVILIPAFWDNTEDCISSVPVDILTDEILPESPFSDGWLLLTVVSELTNVCATQLAMEKSL